MQDHIPTAKKPVLPLLGLIALLSGCQNAVMNPAGDVARQQRDIILISTGLMLLIIIPVMILIVVFAWRYRKGNGRDNYDPSFHHSTSLELVIWAAPLLIIICLGALTWSSTHLLDPFRSLDRISAGRPVDPKVKPLRVQVVALDWKWLFIYPELGIATVNELAVPVDVPLKFEMTSVNMMNTFYAPTLAGMIYAMPGMQSQLHAVLNRPGEYEGMSANYSGAGFSDMRFRLRGMAPADFAKWTTEVRASARPLTTATYMTLEQPSEKVPEIRFASVEPTLFNRVVNRCVQPGRPCMSDVMKHDRHSGVGLPPARVSAPRGEKAKGALFKEGEEKGSGPNRTAPAEPAHERGADHPSSQQKNRNFSLVMPRGQAAGASNV